MEKFIMADGCAVRVRISGEGEKTLLLLHGYLESIEIWESFIPLLEGIRTVAIDLPGHGISEIKDTIHTMEFLARTARAALLELGITRSYVAGHSMGGYAALEYLRLFPEATEGLILLHSHPYADSPEKRALREREIALVESGKKEIIARVNPAARFAPENRRRMAAEIEELADGVFLTEDEGITALLRGMMEKQDNSAMLSESRTPKLFVFGQGDELISLEVAEKMIGQNPDARIVWLEHSGHMGFMEEPEATALAIRSFMDVAECEK